MKENNDINWHDLPAVILSSIAHYLPPEDSRSLAQSNKKTHNFFQSQKYENLKDEKLKGIINVFASVKKFALVAWINSKQQLFITTEGNRHFINMPLPDNIQSINDVQIAVDSSVTTIWGTNKNNQKMIWSYNEQGTLTVELKDMGEHSPLLPFKEIEDYSNEILPEALKSTHRLQVTSSVTSPTYILSGVDTHGQFALWCKGKIPGHIVYNKDGFSCLKEADDFQRMNPPVVLSLSGYKLTNNLRSFINNLACEIENDNAKHPRNKKRNQKVISEIQRVFRKHETGKLTIEDINKSHKRINAIYPSMLVRASAAFLLTGVTTGVLLGIGFALAATFFIFWMPYLIPLAIIIPITVAGFSALYTSLQREKSETIRKITDILITEIKNQPLAKQEDIIEDKDMLENDSKHQEGINYIPL